MIIDNYIRQLHKYNNRAKARRIREETYRVTSSVIYQLKIHHGDTQTPYCRRPRSALILNLTLTDNHKNRHVDICFHAKSVYVIPKCDRVAL